MRGVYMYAQRFPSSELAPNYFEKDVPKQRAVKIFLHSSNKLILSVSPGSIGFDLYDHRMNNFITKTEIDHIFSSEEYMLQPSRIISVVDQLSQIKQSMGINILEMAAILHVSRPTIYEWLASKEEIKLKKQHRERLNNIYEISKLWSLKNLGVLGANLHKPLGDTGLTLFDMLKNDEISQNSIMKVLENIAQIVVTKRKKNKEHEELLRKSQFEPLSKEEREDRLSDFDLLD